MFKMFIGCQNKKFYKSSFRVQKLAAVSSRACQFLARTGIKEVLPQLIDLGRAHPKTKARAIENGEFSHVASLEKKKAEKTSPSCAVKCA